MQHSGMHIRGHDLRVSVELSPRKKIMLSNMFRAESFLKKKGVSSENYALCPKSCKIFNKMTNEDLGQTPRGSNVWTWHDVICASGGLMLSGWEEFST